MCRRRISTDGSDELGSLQSALSAPGRSTAQDRYFDAEFERKAYCAVLEAEKKEVIANSQEPSTTVTHGSHMHSFLEFCGKTGVDPEKFASNPETSSEDLQEEDAVLIAFKQNA